MQNNNFNLQDQLNFKTQSVQQLNNEEEINTNSANNNEINDVKSEEIKNNYYMLSKKAQQLTGEFKKQISLLRRKCKIIDENYANYSEDLKNAADEFKSLLKEVGGLVKKLVREVISIGGLIGEKNYDMAKKEIKELEETYNKLNEKYFNLKNAAENFNLNSITQSNDEDKINAINEEEKNMERTNKNDVINNEINDVKPEEIKKDYEVLLKQVKGLANKIRKQISLLRGKCTIINENYANYYEYLKNAADEFKSLLKEVGGLVKKLVREVISIGGLIGEKNYEMAKEEIKKTKRTYRELNKNFSDLKMEAEIF